MPGPTTPAEALVWAQDAIKTARYHVVSHAGTRMRQRQISIADVKSIILGATAAACSRYSEGRATMGGTCWRITGTSLDDIETSIGTEICRDHLGRLILIITVF